MYNRHDQLWHDLWATNLLNRSIAISLVVHVVALAILVNTSRNFKSARELTLPLVYKVSFAPPPAPKAPEPPKVAKIVTPPKPKPEPPKKIEKPKPKPESKKIVKIVEKPKPIPPKPKETPKAPPKPKPVEKPQPKPDPKPEKKVEKTNQEPVKADIKMKQELPEELEYWGRLVKRKVEKYWHVPTGIRMDEKENEAIVSFFLDRDGDLIGRPEVMKEALDKSLGSSGVRAIQLAAPFPPLPEGFESPEQQVIYVFGLN